MGLTQLASRYPAVVTCCSTLYLPEWKPRELFTVARSRLDTNQEYDENKVKGVDPSNGIRVPLAVEVSPTKVLCNYEHEMIVAAQLCTEMHMAALAAVGRLAQKGVSRTITSARYLDLLKVPPTTA